MFDAFPGCAPITPAWFIYDMILSAWPMPFHLKLMWDDEVARVSGALNRSKHKMLCSWGGDTFLNAPSSDFDKPFICHNFFIETIIIMVTHISNLG